jgi:hypothetical protein
MGAWGTGLFSDDTACDIRDSYRDYLGDGLSGVEARVRILSEYASSFNDHDEFSVAWLALAAVEWKHGRLDAETLKRAIEILDSGRDLVRWEAGTLDYAKRRNVLDKLRTQLTSPQPAEKRVSKRNVCVCDWPDGSLISFCLNSGNFAIFRVIERNTDKGGTYPICELLDWTGSEIPSQHRLRSLPVRRRSPSYPHQRERTSQIMVCGIGLKARKRFTELGIVCKPSVKAWGCSIVHTKFLDKFLKEAFQLE